MVGGDTTRNVRNRQASRFGLVSTVTNEPFTRYGRFKLRRRFCRSFNRQRLYAGLR